jgi:hypothetical protein
MLAKYQLMGSLPLLRLLSTTESEVAVIEKFLELIQDSYAFLV